MPKVEELFGQALEKFGEPKTFEEACDIALWVEKQVMVERQRKYGPENIRKRGDLGVFMRMADDKCSRLEAAYFHRDGTPVSKDERERLNFDDESLDDTWVDVANYATIAQMYRHEMWGLPLQENIEKKVSDKLMKKKAGRPRVK